MKTIIFYKNGKYIKCKKHKKYDYASKDILTILVPSKDDKDHYIPLKPSSYLNFKKVDITISHCIVSSNVDYDDEVIITDPRPFTIEVNNIIDFTNAIHNVLKFNTISSAINSVEKFTVDSWGWGVITSECLLDFYDNNDKIYHQITSNMDIGASTAGFEYIADITCLKSLEDFIPRPSEVYILPLLMILEEYNMYYSSNNKEDQFSIGEKGFIYDTYTCTYLYCDYNTLLKKMKNAKISIAFMLREYTEEDTIDNIIRDCESGDNILDGWNFLLDDIDEYIYLVQYYRSIIGYFTYLINELFSTLEENLIHGIVIVGNKTEYNYISTFDDFDSRRYIDHIEYLLDGG